MRLVRFWGVKLPKENGRIPGRNRAVLTDGAAFFVRFFLHFSFLFLFFFRYSGKTPGTMIKLES